jgi:hypothetical protein
VAIANGAYFGAINSTAVGPIVMPPPTVTSISPLEGPITGSNLVTIVGTNFYGTPTVNFGANPATGVTVVSDTTITAIAPAGSAGPVDVTVTTWTPSATSSSDLYTYREAPSVTGLSPATGGVFGGTPVTISGTGFAGTSEVDFGTYPASILTVSDTQITVTSSGQVATGIQDVRVIAPGGTSAIVPADQFTYGGPILTGLSPATGGVFGGTPVTISGTGFAGATEVDFGTYPASILSVTDTQITVTSSGQVATGIKDVRVIGPFGTSAVVAADQFTYGGPILTGLSTATGPVAGGTPVTISGTGFAGATEVDFGTYPASILSVTDTTITVHSSQQVAPGMQDVRVIAPFGTSAVVAADQFTYT